ncbi:hypothetical protein J6590_087282, partial [Homalodisca vitripennis]
MSGFADAQIIHTSSIVLSIGVASYSIVISQVRTINLYDYFNGINAEIGIVAQHTPEYILHIDEAAEALLPIHETLISPTHCHSVIIIFQFLPLGSREYRKTCSKGKPNVHGRDSPARQSADRLARTRRSLGSSVQIDSEFTTIISKIGTHSGRCHRSTAGTGTSICLSTEIAVDTHWYGHSDNQLIAPVVSNGFK